MARLCPREDGMLLSGKGKREKEKGKRKKEKRKRKKEKGKRHMLAVKIIQRWRKSHVPECPTIIIQPNKVIFELVTPNISESSAVSIT